MIASVMCLAMAVYFEARSEPIIGRYAVAEVIMNRTRDNRFPDTVCAVVKHDMGPEEFACQFSFTCDGKSDKPADPMAWDMAVALAEDVLLNGHTTYYTGSALFYHAKGVNQKWDDHMVTTAVIGNHVFMSEPVRLADTSGD